MTNQALILKLAVRQEGDFFYAMSPDLPGLHVCGQTQEETCESAFKAVKFLFKHNRGMDVDVAPATRGGQFNDKPGMCEQFVVQRHAEAMPA